MDIYHAYSVYYANVITIMHQMKLTREQFDAMKALTSNGYNIT